MYHRISLTGKLPAELKMSPVHFLSFSSPANHSHPWNRAVGSDSTTTGFYSYVGTLFLLGPKLVSCTYKPQKTWRQCLDDRVNRIAASCVSDVGKCDSWKPVQYFVATLGSLACGLQFWWNIWLLSFKRYQSETWVVRMAPSHVVHRKETAGVLNLCKANIPVLKNKFLFN